jgi:hypothetical protein
MFNDTHSEFERIPAKYLATLLPLIKTIQCFEMSGFVLRQTDLWKRIRK